MTDARPHIAPEGKIWVCQACFKKSRDRYGDNGTRWDGSCMLNAVLCDEVQPAPGFYAVSEPVK